MKALTTLVRVMAARQWYWLLAGILAGILVVAANIALMAVSGWFIASMALAGISQTSFNYMLPALAIRVLAIVRTLGRYAERLVTHEAAFRMLADLRVWLFERLIPLVPAGLEGYAAGDLSGRLRSDVDRMENLYLRIIAPIATGAAVILLAPLCLGLWSSASGLALLAALSMAGIGLPLVTRSMAAEPGEEEVRLTGEVRVAVTEGLQGAEELLLLGACDQKADKVEALYAGVTRQQQRLGGINGIVSAGMTAAGGATLAVVLVIGAAEVFRGQISGAELVMLLLFCAACFEGIAPLAAALQALPATNATARRLTELAAAPHPLPEPPHPLPPVSGHGIIFHKVCFAHGAGAEVLTDFSLEIPQGSRVALTGRSGAGKSSVVELLLRFRPYRGSITIGDAEVRDMASSQIAGLVSAVPQQPHLFNSSIRANILLGAPDADNSSIEAALADAGLAEWVAALPDGLETIVGGAGSALSGGEARRIALARALLKDAPLLLLDEPTEGLDPETERTVVQRLKIRLQGKTVLLISHRPACLELAERVLRIDDGSP